MKCKFAPCTKTCVNKKRWWVVIVDNSLLVGTGAPISWPDVLSREVCCLLRAGIRDVTERLPSLAEDTKHYLLLFCMGTSDTGRSWLSRIRKDCRALGITVRNFAELVFFSPVLLVTRVWKGQSNLVDWQMVTGLVLQPGVQLPYYRSLRSMGCQGGHTANSISWTSEKQTLALSEICLVMYRGIEPWKEERHKKADQYLRVTSPKLRSDAFQQSGSQAKALEGLCEWTRSSSTNSDAKSKRTRGRNRGQAGCEECREIFWGPGIRLGKLIELNLPRDMEGNKQSFYRYLSNKRKTRENVNPLWKKMRDMGT